MTTEPTTARPFYVEHRASPDKPWIPFTTFAQLSNAERKVEAYDLLGELARILIKCRVCETTHEVDQCLI